MNKLAGKGRKREAVRRSVQPREETIAFVWKSRPGQGGGAWRRVQIVGNFDRQLKGCVSGRPARGDLQKMRKSPKSQDCDEVIAKGKKEHIKQKQMETYLDCDPF